MLNLKSFYFSALKCAIFLIVCFFVFVSKSFAQVVINEFYTSTSNDWVELYNTSEGSINISGWSLKDNTSTMKTIAATSSAVINGRGFFIVEVSNRLNKDKDEVHLFDSSNQERDSWSYNDEVADNISFGRKPDGGSWHRLQPLSKETSNNDSSIVDPTPTPSPTPTSTPTPTSSPIPSPSLSPNPTSSPEPNSTPEREIKEEIEEASFTGEVLGATESSQAAKTEEQPEEDKKRSKKHLILPFAIIGSGLLFLLAGSFPFVRNFVKKKINKKKQSKSAIL